MRILTLAAALVASGLAFTAAPEKFAAFPSAEAASLALRTDDDGPRMRTVTRKRVIVRGDRGRHLGWERGRHLGWERGMRENGGRRVVKRSITRHPDGSVSRTTVRRVDD